MTRSTPGFLAPLSGKPTGQLGLCNLRTGSVVARSLERAFDSASRRRGLLGRDELPTDTALIIAPCNGVHTCFMRFAIDAIFVARDGRVVKIVRRLAPWRIALALRAFAVVELAAGAAGSEMVAGDRLVISPIAAPEGARDAR